MSPLAEQAGTLLRLRVDAIGYLAVTVAIAWTWRAQIGGVHFRRLIPGLVAIVVAAVTMAEWLAVTTDSLERALQRGVVFSAGLVATVVLLQAHAVITRLRERLRARVGTELRARHARAAADRANRAKSDFLVATAHELRAPIKGLLASADFLARASTDATQRAHALTIANEAKRLQTTANDVLDLRQIEQGRLTLEHVPFAPAELANGVRQLFAAAAQQKGLELRLEARVPADLLVGGDPRRFHQVLVALMDNAIAFTQRGTITLFIGYAAPAMPRQPALVSVRVRDTGVGLEPEQRNRLFRVFALADAGMTSVESGSGLGLVIAQRLVSLMGGQIVVQSRPGEGSEFSFTLAMPLIVPASGMPEMAKNAADAPTCRPRVLIVDDLAANRLMLEMFLERQGFAVEQASDGEEAVVLAGQHRYDAILMDMQMPEVDGCTAARRIRAAEPPGHRSLIVAVTACVGSEARQKCLAAGMDEHVTKPLDLRKFCRALTQMLAARTCHAEVAAERDEHLTSLAAPLAQIAP